MRSVSETILWMAWAIPPTALCAAVYIAIIVPLSVGTMPQLGGNLGALAVAAMSAAALTPACIIPWALVARLAPRVEETPSTMAIAFCVWVVVLGEAVTVLLYGERPSMVHLIPFGLGALAIVSPRLFVPSLRATGSRLAPDH